MRILEFRLKNCLSQNDVSKILNMNQQTYSRYERGENEASYKTLCSLADLFNCTVDELLGRVPEQQLFDDSRVDRPEVLELYEKLTPHQQALILERMNAYIDVNEEAQSSGPRDTYAIVSTGRRRQQ